MPKLKIDGVGTIQVDDSFTKLSPADQNAFVMHVVDQTKQGVKSGGGDALPAMGSAAPHPASAAAMAPQVSSSGSTLFDDMNVPSLTDGPAANAPQMPYGEQMRNVASTIGRGADQAVRGLADGMTFGLADRLAAAGDLLTKGGSYGKNLADERAKTDAVGSALPGLNTALRTAGGLVTGGALARGGLSLAANLPEAVPLLARLPAFATDGAIAGAADAVGHDDSGSLGGKLDAAGRGATTGALLGGGLPAAAGLAAGAAGVVAPFLAKPVDGASRLTSGLLSKLMTQHALDAVSKLGPDASLADASPSLLGLAQGVASKPGVGADTLVDFVNARHAGQSDRLVGNLNTNLGPAFSPADIAGQLDIKRQGLLPLLAQANASPSIWNADLAEMAQRPAMQKALRTASDTAANEGRPLPMVSLDEQGREVSPAARQAYEGYAANAGQHVDAALSDLLGSDGALAKSDDLIAARKAAADPLYAQFRASNVPMTDDLAELLKRPSIKSALPAAERLAQDEGKTIFLKAPGEDGSAPIGGDDSRPFTPLEAYDEAQVARPTKPDVPRPQDLHSFVKSLGGVQDPKGDLKAMGLDAVPGLIAKEGKGLGPDAVRQAAAEAGYLGPHIDNAMADTTIGDLHDALSHDRPVHSVYDEDAAARWAGYDQARGEFDRSGTRNGGAAGRNIPGLPDPGPDAPQVRQITPEGWDYVKRALDDRISNAKSAGSNNEARVYTGLKGELTGALDKAVPVYAQARQIFAGHSALSDALEAGQASVAGNVSREQVRREFGGLGTDGERHMYRLGMANGLREMVARRQNGPNVAAPLATRQMGDKLSTVTPSPEALTQFQQRVADTHRSFTEAQRPDVRGLRYALDALDKMRSKATGNQAAAVGQTGDALRAQLETVPDFARADLGARTIDRGQQAFDIGRGVLRQTDTAPTPTDLSRLFDKLPLEQQALLRAGSRSDIEQRFGQNPNDLSALKRIVGGDNDFNRANMGTLFGPEATRSMVDAAEREQAFAATRNAIAAGSRTAPMQAGSKAIDDATAPRAYVVPKDATLLGLLGNAAEHGVRKSAGLIAAMTNEATRNELGGLLSATGSQREAITSGLMGALMGRDRLQAAIRSAIENPAAAPALAALPPRRRRASR